MSHYLPGVPYVFRSLSETGLHTNQITVTYDAIGNATVSRTVVPVAPGDTRITSVFAPPAEYTYTGGLAGTVTILGNINKYFFVYFDNPVKLYDTAMAVAGGGNTVTITCTCKKNLEGASNGDCTVSYMWSSGCLNYSCVPDASCADCKDPKVSSGIAEGGGGGVLLWAESVNNTPPTAS